MSCMVRRSGDHLMWNLDDMPHLGCHMDKTDGGLMISGRVAEQVRLRSLGTTERGGVAKSRIAERAYRDQIQANRILYGQLYR